MSLTPLRWRNCLACPRRNRRSGLDAWFAMRLASFRWRSCLAGSWWHCPARLRAWPAMSLASFKRRRRNACWTCCRTGRYAPGFASRPRRNWRPLPWRGGWARASSWRAACWSCSRTRWRRNILRVLGFNLLFHLGSIGNTLPAVFNLWLRDFGFHCWRRNAGRRLGELRRCTYHELVALHFGERPRFSSGRQISGSLPLDSEPLNRPARVLVNDVVIRAVIIDHIVLNVDVGHVHRVGDIGNVLCWWKDPVPQNRFTDKTNVAKVVIFRADIVFDVHGGADGLSFIDDFRTTRWQGRPADAVSTGSPRYPSRSPVQIAAWDPDPAVIR